MADNANCSLITDCETCGNTGCLTCRVGYSLDNGGASCTKDTCNVPNCLYCAADGTCLRCLSSFTLSNNVCSSVTCNLTNCQTCKKNSRFCDGCQAGYMLNIWTGQCENHSINVTNCVSFMIDSSNQLRCIKCDSNLMPSKDQLSCVLNCRSDCQACSNSLTCTTCKPGFTLSSGNCIKNNCTNTRCTLCATNSTCLACDGYSTLSGGSCVAASCSSPHCSLCLVGSAECEVCAEGYALNTWSHECIQTPISGCLQVLDYSQRSFICSQCSSGLTPSADQLTCLSSCSVSNCLTCSGSTCSACMPGYQLQGRVCNKIACTASNCLLCGSGQICHSCNSGFAVSEGLCVAAKCELPYC